MEPLLPTGQKSGRPPAHAKRQLTDGIRWRTRAGAPWRNAPERYRQARRPLRGDRAGRGHQMNGCDLHGGGDLARLGRAQGW
ncbi:transposase [Streptomyces sp. IBSBF 3136]|uniref:transposase n=1 Tax=Streptomyces sp. IBSBF 3136 TaxID=2903524 RepID=UPI002FDC4A9D